MFGMRWRLFRLLGIPISVDASWLIILALLTLSFASGFPAILHEYFPGATHSSPAMSTGSWAWSRPWPSSLHPAPRVRPCRRGPPRGMPIRGITLFLFGGVSELGEEPLSARTEFLMAIAGPAVSVVLAIVLWLLAVVGYHGGWPHPVVIVLGYLAAINGLVLVFNLIPAFPLDGGRVLRSILWGASRQRAAGDLLGLSGRPGLRLVPDRLGHHAVLHGQLAWRDLDRLDRDVPEQCGPEWVPAGSGPAGAPGRAGAPLHEP